jgi:putative heme-binding domain-containing protein
VQSPSRQGVGRPRAARRGRSRGVALALAAITLGATLRPSTPAAAQEGATPPHWIWTATRGTPGAETRYFRKTFSVKEPSRLVLDATADNAFVLYLDGRKIAEGGDWHVPWGVEARIATGPHVLAASATNEDPGPAGFLVRGGILPLGQGVPIHTNPTWKASETVPEGAAWTAVDFDDSSWTAAVDLGELGTGPWGDVFVATGDASGRFRTPEGFRVTAVAAPRVTGSAISLNFDPQGRPCVGVERGPIVRLLDADRDGQYEGKEVIAPRMSNCQGFAFIGDALFAVGDGPQGAGLYRLRDADADGVFEAIELVRATKGGMGEHGPHAVTLGPDGWLYDNNGNHAHLLPPIDPASPINAASQYEGELLPHYDDARGHAAGIMAPGGEILRSPDGGKTWQRVVAGFRNEYDFAFNRDGELFTFDSDMEWDIGLPWYRPVRVNHCPPGAEFGWRNGSGKWPPYYFDSLPAVLDTGRGSPTGVTFYQGRQFPADYDDNFLICDWSQGRILAIELTRDGATYKAKQKELVSGQPLNCTDIEVGPDGAVYFTTGGRGTLGGLFRVSWAGARPEAPPADPIAVAVAIGSPQSSFARERIGRIKAQLGDKFSTRLAALAVEARAPAADRIRALDLLAQFEPRFGQGIVPEVVLLALARDDDAAVRAHAVAALGRRRSDACRAGLIDALADVDAFVRRRACEGLARQPAGAIPVDRLIPLLSDPDRWIRYAARNALEHADPVAVRAVKLPTQAPRPIIEWMLVLVRSSRLDGAGPLDPSAQDWLLGQQAALLASTRLDRAERLDLLRLIGLTYLLGPRKPADVPASAEFRRLLLAAFPAGDVAPDRETARLLAFLGEPKAVAAILKAQASEADHATQIHYTYCLRAIQSGWTPEAKRQLWAWYETASHWDGGYSFLGYLDFMAQELVALLTPAERGTLLAEGVRTPFPTRVLVRSLDLDADPGRVADLAALYPRLAGTDDPRAAASDLRTVIREKLGQSAHAEAHAALRGLAQADLSGRDLIARALASRPTAEDLPLLVAALESSDRNTTGAVVGALRRLKAAPEGPEGLRNLIRLARRVGPPMRDALTDLATRWTGSPPPTPGADFAATLGQWEKVYAEMYPTGPPLAEAATTRQDAYTLPQLVAQVVQAGLVKRGSPERGLLVVAKAKCLDCHKLGDRGQGLGPDLTTVASRFQPQDILESIVEPSKVISDQYKSVMVATVDGQVYNGMPAGGDDRQLVLLLSDGTKATIPKADIDEQAESKVSVMPAGLLNGLTLQEIADLLALFEAQPRVEAPVTSPRE